MSAYRPALAVRLFGNFGMEVDGQPFVMATPRRTLPILAYLLLNRGNAVSREFLSYFMWPDDSEESARTKLRANLHELGRILPPAPPGHWLAIDGDNLSWNPAAPLRLDTEEFETCCADRERRDEGVDLYRGELLATLYEEWIFPPRERYRNLYLATLTELVSDARRTRDFPRAIARAQQLLAVDPWREDIVRRLVAIRYESGDRTGALVEYERFAERLRAELDVEPMPETVALREAIARDAPIDREPASRRASPAPLGASPSLPFVGREADLALLDEAWNRAAQGNGTAVFVGGESGIGKSRLALEFARRVEESGGRALLGTTGTPEAMPYQSLVEALRSALPLVASLRVRDVWLAAVATLVPELRAQLPALPEPARIGTEGEQRRLFESLVRTLSALAAARPVLLVVEDAQWAEEATSAAVDFLLARIATLRIMLVITYRDNELPRLHPLQRLRRDSVAAGHARSISLRPLALSDVEKLIELLPSALEADAAALYASSEGNPLFLTQLVDGGTGSGAREPAATVRSLVTHRLDGLTAATRTIAEIAALVGTQFSREVVRRVSGWDGASTDDALDELIERRIVREAPGRGFFDYAFAHHLVQQIVAENAEAERAAARHRRIARAFEELYPERMAELAPRIARHYDLAGDAAAAAAYLAAATQAVKIGALDEAASQFARGLEITKDQATRVALLLVGETLGARHVKYGDRREISEQLERLTAGSAGEQRREVLLRLAAFANQRKDAKAEGAALAELRELVEAAGDERWRGRLYEAEAMHYLESDDLSRAEASARASLEAFLRCEDHAGEAEARGRLADIATLRGDLGRAESLLEEARLAADRVNDTALSVRALKALYQTAFYRGDTSQCLRISQAFLDLGIASGDRNSEAEGHMSMANALSKVPGKRNEAVSHLREATAIREEIGDHIGRAVSLVMNGVFDLIVGDLAAARAKCERAMRIYERHPPPARLMISAQLTLAIALLLGEDAVRAKAIALEAAEKARAIGYPLLEAAALGNVADAEGAARDYPAAIEHMERSFRLWETAAGQRGPSLASLALWSAALGKLDAARSYARISLAAEQSFAQISFWPQQPYWFLAQTFRALGEPERAQSLLQKARALTSEALETLDERERADFLRLPWHRDLLAAADLGIWPDPPR